MDRYVYSKIIVFLLLLISSFTYSQCLCSDIKFKLMLKDDISFYSIKTIQAPYFASIKEWRGFNKNESNGRIINFQFNTQGGIDILSFIIKNNKNNKTMKITVRNMTYDNPYFIDLNSFTKGNYLFDWNKINKCQRNNANDKLVKCGRMKFYQLQLKSEKELKETNNNFSHNKIKPYNLKYFKD